MAPNDHAVWKFEVPGPGEYAVWLDWSCSNDSAGNMLEVCVGSQRVRFKVAGTGTWDHFTLSKIGHLELSGSKVRLEVRPAAAPHNDLLDLRHIELRPLGPARQVSSAGPDRAAGPDSDELAARRED